MGKAWVCSRESVHWLLCLKGFYLFSKGGNFRGGLNRNIHQLSRCVLWYADILKWAYKEIRACSGQFLLQRISPKRKWEQGSSAQERAACVNQVLRSIQWLGKIRSCNLLAGCKLFCQSAEPSVSVSPFHLPGNFPSFLLTSLKTCKILLTHVTPSEFNYKKYIKSTVPSGP